MERPGHGHAAGFLTLLLRLFNWPRPVLVVAPKVLPQCHAELSIITPGSLATLGTAAIDATSLPSVLAGSGTARHGGCA